MTAEVDARSAPLSTRRLGHLLVDAALLGLAAALIAVVLAVPGPDLCPASLPVAPECSASARDRIALVAVLSVGVLAIVGWIANHVLRGPARWVVLVVIAAAAVVAGLTGASLLSTELRILGSGIPLG